MTDQEIINKIRDGDENNVISIIDIKTKANLINWLVTKGHNYDTAKDLYQDSIITFLRKVKEDDFILTSKLTVFLYGIAYNLALKEFKRISKFVKIDDIDISYDQHFIYDNYQIDMVNHGLNNISERDSEVLKLFYFDKFNMIDISQKMGFNGKDTAKTFKHKALKRFVKKMKQLYKKEDFYKQ